MPSASPPPRPCELLSSPTPPLSHPADSPLARSCRELHDICVDFAGPKSYHHVMDCVPTQAGPEIKAFCGGKKKKSNGNWAAAAPVDDFTRAALAEYKGEAGAWVKAKPIGNDKCKAYAKKNPR